MGMPLENVAARGDRDDDAGPRVFAERPAQALCDGFGAALGQVEQQLATPAE
jgi:hypothetical protein